MADNSSPPGDVNDEFHPRFDRSNKQNVARLVALSLTSWRIQRGRGPRNHDFCLYCRGDLTDDCEIFVHEDGKCRNAWPLSCFLEWLKMELAEPRYARCPVCRASIASPWDMEPFCKAKDPCPDPPVALLRFSLFSPDFVLHCGLQEKRPIIFMEVIPQNGLSQKMFKGDATLFRKCQAITRAGESQNVEFNYMAFQNPDTSLGSRIFRALVLVDFGHNIFRMCTFLPQEMENLRSKLVAGGANVRLMSGESFDAEAELKGGLAATLDGISAGELDGCKQAIENAGVDFMCGTEGAREPWADQAYFHLLKAMVAAGNVGKDIDNPRFKAFSQNLAQYVPLTMPLNPAAVSSMMNAGNGPNVSNSNASNSNAAVADDDDDDDDDGDDGDDDYDDDDDDDDYDPSEDEEDEASSF